VILPVHPKTDLISPPAAGGGSAGAGGGTAGGGGSLLLRPLLVRAVAVYLGIAPAHLRAQLMAGKTLRQIAHDHGSTPQQLRSAVLARLGATLGKLLGG